MALWSIAVWVEHMGGGKSEIWQALGIPLRRPIFFDGHNLLAALDCARDGFDPLFHNPCDAAQRVLNYPRIWLLLLPTGLGRGNEALFGIITAACLGLALLVLARPRSGCQLGIWSLAIVSPAVQFGVERGNTDLWIFGLVVGALSLQSRWHRCSLLLLYAATLLKLFPAAAVISWRKPGQPAAQKMWFVFVLGAGMYALAFQADMRQILTNVPDQGAHTYGAPVLGRLLLLAVEGNKAGSHSEEIWRGAGHVIAGLVFAAIAAITIRQRARSRQPLLPREIYTDHRFAAGAGIYLLSYLGGSNWNYRLLFLLLLLPALLGAKNHFSPGHRKFCGALLALLLAVLWSSGYPRYYLLYVDEWLALLLAGVLVSLLTSAAMNRQAAPCPN